MIVTERKVSNSLRKGQEVSIKSFEGDLPMVVVKINDSNTIADIESVNKKAVLKWKEDGWYQNFTLVTK